MGKLGGNYVNIDSKKLKDIFYKRGLTYQEVSQAIGFEDSFISNVLKSEKLNQPAAKLLKLVYNIEPAEYELCDEPEPVIESEKIVEPQVGSMDYDKLYQVVYSAVYEAIKMAFE